MFRIRLFLFLSAIVEHHVVSCGLYIYKCHAPFAIDSYPASYIQLCVPCELHFAMSNARDCRETLLLVDPRESGTKTPTHQKRFAVPNTLFLTQPILYQTDSILNSLYLSQNIFCMISFYTITQFLGNYLFRI